MTVVSQDEEEVWGFENLGAGRGPARFRSRRLWFTHNHDLGSAGLVPTDFDGDGDLDLLLPTGDNFEYRYTYPQPYHGCLLIRNDGDWTWAVEPLADLGGTYAAAVGEMGIVLVSMFNAWHRHDAASVLLVSPGSGNRRSARVISTRPSHLSTVDCGDLDGDGHNDLAVAVHQANGTFNGKSRAWLGDGKRGFREVTGGFRTSGTTDVAIASANKVGSRGRVVFCNSIGGRYDEAVPVHVYWGGRDGFDPERVWKLSLIHI